jgi:DNA repair exonuclease SbcCD nuclease subunit
VEIDLDALALGDYHEFVGTAEREVKIWYAGSTERCAVDEKEARSVSLLEIEDGELTRWQKELDTRDFETITINFAKNDGYGHAEDEIDRYVVENKFVFVTVVGKSNTVTSSDVRGIVMDRGAAVCRVEDERGGPEIDTSDTPNGDVQNKDKRIEEKLAEKDISGIVAQIDERVRTEGVSPSGFDNEVEEMVMQAQAEAFDETAESTTTEMADK